MNRSISIYYFLIVVLIFSVKGISQNYDFKLSANDDWVPQFTTYQELSNGKLKTNQVTLRVQKEYNGAPLNDWKITVKLQDDFVNTQNNAYSVSAEHAQLSFSNETSQGAGTVNPSNVPVSLSKFNEVDLIRSNIPFTSNQYIQRVFTFNLFIAGGTHLLTIPNGQYLTNYEFRLYGRQNDGSYSLIASTYSGARSGLSINYSGNHGNQNIILQNTANVFDFVFAEPNDYINGKSIEIQNGLKVTSYNTHQITVKSSNSDFTSQTTTGMIPVSVLRVEASLNNAISNVALHGPLTMSTADQTLISRTATWPQTIEYNLKFFIPPNQIQNPVEQGNYTAYIYFTIVPN